MSELTPGESNMGNMSKSELISFFTFVTDDLGVALSLEFTPTSPSIYLDGKVLFCEQDLDGYKWQVKERILHEIAHHFEVGRRRHGANFYKVYVELVSKYMAKSQLAKNRRDKLSELLTPDEIESIKEECSMSAWVKEGAKAQLAKAHRDKEVCPECKGKRKEPFTLPEREKELVRILSPGLLRRGDALDGIGELVEDDGYLFLTLAHKDKIAAQIYALFDEGGSIKPISL